MPERSLAVIVERLEHLDECLDDLKRRLFHDKEGKIPMIEEALRRNDRRWERAIMIVMGAIFAASFLSGNGLFSLKQVISIIGK